MCVTHVCEFNTKELEDIQTPDDWDEILEFAVDVNVSDIAIQTDPLSSDIESESDSENDDTQLDRPLRYLHAFCTCLHLSVFVCHFLELFLNIFCSE